MEIIQIESIEKLETDTSLALGFFDGIHLGHRAILNKAIEEAKTHNLSSALLTFNQHPMEILHSGLCFPYLTTLKEKIYVANKLNLDYFVIMRFDENTIRIEPEDFIKNILFKKLHSKILVVGEDYRFGARARGDIKMLKEVSDCCSFQVDVLEDVKIDNIVVSSTNTREAILGGNIELANKFLGRWYSIEGEVIHGNKRGRKIGVRTANINLPHEKVMPRQGIYSVAITIDGEIFEGVANVGDSPTFDETHSYIEINIFNFDKDIYDKKIRVFFAKWLREISKFSNTDELKNAILNDVKASNNFFTSISKNEILKNVIFR